MSKSRQADTVDVRTFGVTFRAKAPSPFVPPVTPGWHQLVHVSRGAVTVRASGHDWLVIPQRALWIPAGTSYQIRLAGEVALRSLYLRRSRRLDDALSRECLAVNVSPLCRELILRAVAHGALDRRVLEQRHLIAVLRDEVQRLPAVPLQLPLPEDERAARLVQLLEASPPCSRGALARMLQQSGASRRTLERIFRAETGMSLGRWIRRHDLLLAARLIASGAGVAETAETLGYNSPSAFIAMFKRELGQTPGSYVA